MARFAIFIKVQTENQLTFDRGTFLWEVRPLNKGVDDRSDISENTGPTLARGAAETSADAKAAAEAFVNLMAQEEVYVYEV